MTSQLHQSKIEQSPHFEKIVEFYRTHKNTLSKKEIFDTYIQPLDPALRYHQFIRLTVKLESAVAVEASQVITHYVDGEVNTAKIRQELYLKALQLGDQSLTSTLELWEKHPEKISSRQLRDFFKMYGEMEKVRQTDKMIDLKKQEQDFEQKFKPAGMFANIWVEALHLATAGGITDEDVKLLNNTMTSIFARMEERNNQKSDFQIPSQNVQNPI